MLAARLLVMVSTIGLVSAMAGALAGTPAGAILASTTTVSLSSSAAGATNVTYTVGFQSSAAVPANGTITLVAPPGTLWPSNNCNYSLTDSTTPSASFGTCAIATPSFGRPGLPVFSFLSYSGSAVTIEVPNAIAAGDSISLTISGVENPAAGSGTISVSSPSGTAPMPSPAYTITAGQSVSTPVVSLSSSAANATNVTYTVGFTTSSTGDLGGRSDNRQGGSITLVAPPGTLWPSSNCDYSLTDSTTSSGSFTTCSGAVLDAANPGLPVYNFFGQSGSTMTIEVPNAISAGDSLTLTVAGVENPAAGSGAISVRTSADTAIASSAPYTVTAGQSVSTPTVSLSSSAVGATNVSYTIGFNTSTTGALVDHADNHQGGTITLVGPPGTVWPTSNCDYSLTDSTTPGGSFNNCDGAVVLTFGQGSTVTIEVPNAIAAGDSVALTVTGVENPSAGSGSISVRTSSDTAPATSASYAITAGKSVSTPAVSLSSSTAGATGVTYTVDFIASSDGALASNANSRKGGSITLVAPPGTVWPSGTCDYSLTDSTTSSGSFTTCAGWVSLDFGQPSTVTIKVPANIHAGDSLSLKVTGVTNPGAGTDALQVRTSADTALATSLSYTLTGSTVALTSVSSPSLSTTSTASGASGVTYTVGFTASASGQLAANSGTITLAAPAGTVFNPNGTYSITDATTSSSSGGAFVSQGLAGDGSIVTVTPLHTINAGDSITLTITEVTNPPAGAGQLSISTSSDAVPVDVADTTTSAASVGATSLSATSTAGNASGITYTVGLTTSSTGDIEGGLGSITLAAPAGTVFGACPYGCGGGNATYTITDSTNSSGSGPATPSQLAGDGSIVSIVPSKTIHAGDAITLTITQVTNPPAGAGQLTISTSSDPTPVSVADTTTAPAALGATSLSAGSTAGGATDVTYTVGFTTSATGELLGGLSSVTLLAPPGTVFAPSASASITDSTSTSGSGNVGSIGVLDGGAMANFLVPNTILAGDSVTLKIGGVTNPPTGANSLEVTTSSDPVLASATTATQPSSPQDLIATPGDAKVSLAWTPPQSNGGSTVTSYNVYMGTTSGAETFLTNVSGTNYLATGLTNGLTNGTEYYFFVTAVNSVGEGQKSSEANATPEAPITTPSDPHDLTATASTAAVSLTWSQPVSDGGSSVTSYNVYMGTTSGAETFLTNVSGTNYTATGLTNGTTYYFYVTAVNSAGEGQKSAEVYATPEQPAPVISSVTPSSGSSAGHRYIEIFGTNLSPGGKVCLWYLGTGCTGVSVSVGGNQAFVIYASSTELLVLSPPGAPGTVDITVAVDGQSSAISPKDEYIYV